MAATGREIYVGDLLDTARTRAESFNDERRKLLRACVEQLRQAGDGNGHAFAFTPKTGEAGLTTFSFAFIGDEEPAPETPDGYVPVSNSPIPPGIAKSLAIQLAEESGLVEAL